jgi:putative ABC transport system permease protein
VCGLSEIEVSTVGRGQKSKKLAKRNAQEMFLRLVADSFRRRPRHKLLTGAALALGMAVATAALSVSLDVGDRLAREFRSLGANLLVTSQADSLPLEIGGVDYRPVNAGAYLPESDLPKIKTVFWHNNIIAFSPMLEARVRAWSPASKSWSSPGVVADVPVVGTWINHPVALSDGATFATGIEKTNPWWHVDGHWFSEGKNECVVGRQLAQRRGLKPGDTITLQGRDIAPKSSALVDDQSSAVSIRKSHSLVVRGLLSTGGSEEDAVVLPLTIVQQIAAAPGQYRRLYVSALTKPEDDFGRRDPATMNPDELERWSCSPYVSSIAYSIKQVLPGSDVRVIRRVAEGEGRVLTRVRTLLWLVTFAALLAAGLAVGASSAASVIERRTEIGLMKALGAGSGIVGFLLAAEQLLLAFVGGGIGYALGIFLARLLGERIFGAAPSPSLLVLLVILALAAIVTLLGSAVPLRRAARYEPAPILRGE